VTKRLTAFLLLAGYLFAVAAAIAWASTKHVDRVIGFGQIRFQGAGPERWASRYRRQHRLVASLRHQLVGRLDRIVWLVDAFGCIHRYEGAWDANTGNGYYGGLQMDRSFMSAYAPDVYRAEGTADNWSPSEQIATAIVAYTVRGFEPWPNTARMCGLR
jgi:hypothetical protein